MPILRLFFIFAFLSLSVSVFAQDADKAVKEKLRQQSNFLEQILGDAKNLRLPENRAFVYAKIAGVLWQSDEKRARKLFQDSINELIAAQTDAETEKGNKEYLNNLIYGQAPRWEILNAIAARDAEFALDALVKTRTVKINQALSSLNGDSKLPSRQYARSEIQNEQRLIAIVAEQSPQRAIKLLRENLKKEVNYDTINLLKKIHQKDAETAGQLAGEVGQKLLDSKLSDGNQDLSLIQYFLSEFGQEKTSETQTLTVSDALLKDLSEKIVKFALRPNSPSNYTNPSALKVVERFFPANVAQIKQKQIKNENQNQQYQSYSKLIQGDASPEELLAQVEKFPASYRNEIYRKAAEKTAQSGNIVEAQKILTSNLSEEESERYLSQFNYNLANQAISKGNFNEASQIINQLSDENIRLNALIYLATSIYQKAPQENQKWASTILEQARSLLSNAPEKTSEINSLVNIGAAYALIDSEQSFRLIESLTSPLNEFSEASAVVAKFSDYGNFRQGEYQISSGNNPLGVYNLISVLQTLKNKDFERAMQFVNGFSRLDARISLKVQLFDWNLPINSVQASPMMIISSGRHHFTIDKK